MKLNSISNNQGINNYQGFLEKVTTNSWDIHKKYQDWDIFLRQIETEVNEDPISHLYNLYYGQHITIEWIKEVYWKFLYQNKSLDAYYNFFKKILSWSLLSHKFESYSDNTEVIEHKNFRCLDNINEDTIVWIKWNSNKIKKILENVWIYWDFKRSNLSQQEKVEILINNLPKPVLTEVKVTKSIVRHALT